MLHNELRTGAATNGAHTPRAADRGLPDRIIVASVQVRFRYPVHRRANVHIEHGHAVDWLTRAERDFSDGEPPSLRLPFGSLISRYLLNVLERRVPPRASVPPGPNSGGSAAPGSWRPRSSGSVSRSPAS